MSVLCAGPETIGVVVPVYNAESYLDDCVRSISLQNHADWRCVFIDDGSSDASVERLRKLVGNDERFNVVMQANAGPGAARNAGYLAMKHRWPQIGRVIFFDADDVWHHDALETLVAFSDRHSASPAVYALGRDVDSAGKPRPGEKREDWMRNRRRAYGWSSVSLAGGEPTSFESLAYAPCIVNGGVLLVRCGAFERVGGFEAALRGPEDWDLWIRLARLGELPWTDCVVLDYRVHGGGVSSDRSRTVKAVQTVRLRAASDPSNTREQRCTALRSYRAFYLDMGRSRIQGLRRNFSTQSLKLSVANVMMGLIGRPLGPDRSIATRSKGTLGETLCPTSA